MNDAGSNNDIDDVGRAPSFKDRVIVAGLGPYALKFDNIFTGAVQNSSVPGLKLTAAYARASGVEYYANRGDDVNLYTLEANYRLGFDAFKLGFDAMYKGSRTNGQMGESHLDGNMYNLRVGIYELAGFSASYAYSINSKNNSTILGIGNGLAHIHFCRYVGHLSIQPTQACRCIRLCLTITSKQLVLMA